MRKAGLDALYFTGIHRLARPLFGGLGAILTFNHVRPPREDAFQPNRRFEISPDFFAKVVAALTASGVDIVSIDEAHARLVGGERKRRFVVLSFDGGYRDNLAFAWPQLERSGVPFVVYVASAFADGHGELWWRAVEEAIAGNDRLVVDFGRGPRAFDCATTRAKYEVYRSLYGRLRSLGDEADLRHAVRAIAVAGDVDLASHCRAHCMDWDEIVSLARSPLVTIGTHSESHAIFAKLRAGAVRTEMVDGAARIKQMVGVRPAHLAYPVGDRSAAGPREFAIAAEVGFKTAVTARPGVLFTEHAHHLTALPRIAVNGDFQRLRYLKVLMSGAATALWNGFRRLDAA